MSYHQAAHYVSQKNSPAIPINRESACIHIETHYIFPHAIDGNPTSLEGTNQQILIDKPERETAHA